jgi:hypothetical protein
MKTSDLGDRQIICFTRKIYVCAHECVYVCRHVLMIHKSEANWWTANRTAADFRKKDLYWRCVCVGGVWKRHTLLVPTLVPISTRVISSLHTMSLSIRFPRQIFFHTHEHQFYTNNIFSYLSRALLPCPKRSLRPPPLRVCPVLFKLE